MKSRRNAKRGPWLWGRVAGDALDIAAVRNPAAIAALAGVTPLDVAAVSAVTRGIARTKKERAGSPLSVEGKISA